MKPVLRADGVIDDPVENSCVEEAALDWIGSPSASSRAKHLKTILDTSVLAKHIHRNVLFLIDGTLNTLHCMCFGNMTLTLLIIHFLSISTHHHIQNDRQGNSLVSVLFRGYLSYIVLFSLLYCCTFFLHCPSPSSSFRRCFWGSGLAFTMYVKDNGNVQPLQKFEPKKYYI